MLVVLLPITILVAIAIRLNSSGPIFYSQVRTGLNGKKFRVYKFRSMYQDAEARGIQWAKEKDPRITSVGSFIRLTRIDELPQLWNVFKGDMSLVGPRPERPEFDLQLRKEIPYYGRSLFSQARNYWLGAGLLPLWCFRLKMPIRRLLTIFTILKTILFS